MKQEQYQAWTSKRKEITSNEEYYSNIGAWQSTLDNLPAPSNSNELNPEIPELDFVQDIISGKKNGYYYARTNHPNFTQLEEILKGIEVGRLSHPEYFSCKVFPSGMSAIKSTLEALSLGEDGVFIHGNTIYPSTKNILADRGGGKNMTGTKPGIEIDLNKLFELEKAIKESRNKGNKVLGVVMEPVTNPTIAYTNTREIARIANHYSVPLVVDNTFLTPYLFEPFRAGADIVIHSLTKYFSGQGDMTGGAVIMPKEWENAIQEIRRHGGSIMSIRDAYEFAKRAPAVGQRIQKHSQNARILSKKLKEISDIKVNYNDLAGQTREGYAGGVLSFEFGENDRSAYRKARGFSQYIIDNPKIAEHRVSLAERKTLILPYAGLVDMDILQSLNIPTGLVRIATGRENNYLEKSKQIKEAIEANS